MNPWSDATSPRGYFAATSKLCVSHIPCIARRPSSEPTAGVANLPARREPRVHLYGVCIFMSHVFSHRPSEWVVRISQARRVENGCRSYLNPFTSTKYVPLESPLAWICPTFPDKNVGGTGTSSAFPEFDTAHELGTSSLLVAVVGGIAGGVAGAVVILIVSRVVIGRRSHESETAGAIQLSFAG